MFVSNLPKLLLTLNIQYFADEPPADDSSAGEENPAPTYTEQDFQTRLQEELAKAKADHENEVATARTEAEKLAKMTADQKATYELEKREQELATKEQKIAARELRSETLNMLADAKYNLPAEVIDLVLGADAETTTKNIETFKQVFDVAVQKSVEERLAGKSPSSGTPTTQNGQLDVIREQFAKALGGGF
ncbi:DUF4355 domain-containing protein [Lysinibacillus piscis]|uniref:DUF4355 domain-containing protein n=1 Tax=Lysinibacillus piscis TaxID=2518931 RepID=A0ABQ5NHJ2_9BACI|nr:DUF4355 domain-containing protein [Lysinibacillus sp. KH24]GLC87499.1 hypothetical protein LYSBPC_06260 [Lysinibacillus sp. KH24]